MPYTMYPEYLIHWSISNTHTVHLIALSIFLEEETIQVSIIRVRELGPGHSFLIVIHWPIRPSPTTRWLPRSIALILVSPRWERKAWTFKSEPGNVIYIKAVSGEPMQIFQWCYNWLRSFRISFWKRAQGPV